MASRPWSDEDLLEVLKDALAAARAVPRGFVEAGKAAYAWRTIDAELAHLLYDSANHGTAPLLRAEDATLRALRYASAGLTIELELTPDALLGQILPAQPGSVGVFVAAEEVAAAHIDELGFFAVRPVPPGPFRLLVRAASGASGLTGWVTP
ncbi:hypothetical protein [Phytohabitans rumicis]|uniref:Uncharacterized protein n=1 Tax=Phytohabitans rumicis TaxID=1076125 RepID=A0A6V8L6X8_9ACTN|nr:hypothetical protein [Phytohabitans rumicis]GFJ88405.1 hypothetical protein Prum_020470 [Phytohabitans rumicis]